LLDVIEIDPDLCAVLEHKFGHLQNVRIHCISLLDWDPGYEYDHVVSALPHNTFGIDFVSQVLDRYQKFTKSGGTLSYVELLFFAKIKPLFLIGQKKVGYKETQQAIAEFRDKFSVGCSRVIRNIPPARILHLEIHKEN